MLTLRYLLPSPQVDFASPALGTLDELFECWLEGQPQPLQLRFRGQVVGPTFDCDVDELDFAAVAFGFPATRFLTLTNTSPIPMSFRLHVPASTPAAREVEVTPAEGEALEKRGRFNIFSRV